MAQFAFKEAYDLKHSELAAANAEQATVTFESCSELIEGLHTEARIRDFTVTVDEPEALGGSDKGPNPVEIVLAALGTCQEITYRLYADAMGIPLDGISVRVEGDLDLRGLFAAKQGVRPGFGAIRATVTMDSPADEADLRRLKETVDRHCPVLDILSQPVPVETAIVVENAPAPAAE